MEQNGKKPELFGDIVRAAILLLERLIAKVMQKIMEFAEKVIGKAAVIEEMAKESESHIQAEDEPLHKQEMEKIPFPFNHHRREETHNKTEQTQQKGSAAVRESIIEQVKAGQKSVPDKTRQPETERSPKPQPSILAAKYPRLKEIDDKLKEQNRAIYEREKKRDKLKKGLSECTGIFKGGRRKELQQEIDSINKQISNMKKHLFSIVKEYKFDSVQAFYKEFNPAKKEYFDYQAARAEWEKTYGDKAADTMSVRDRLRQKQQMIKEKEVTRAHQARQKDRGAR